VLETVPSNLNSFASQISFVQNFGTVNSPQYMFSGRRHSFEDPCFMAEKWGSHIMTPLKFDDAGKPVVYWKKSFDWMSKSSFDWESDDNKIDQFPIDEQYFKPVCDATDNELFCIFNPNPDPETCRIEYDNKNLECELSTSSPPPTSTASTVAPKTAAPTTSAPAPTVICQGLSKNKCAKHDTCAYGSKKLKNCHPKEGREHECSEYQTKSECKQKTYCNYKNDICAHKCDNITSKKECKKVKESDNNEKICTFIKEINPCEKCNPITCN